MTIIPFSSAAHDTEGKRYFEHRIGNFVVSEGRFVTNVSFSDEDAEWVARLLLRLGDVSSLVIALYPWVDSVWQTISKSDWITFHTRTFMRNPLASAGANRWVVGSAQSVQRLVDVVLWAWTLPGRDTLLFIPGAGSRLAPLLDIFEDDQEDTDTNERRLLTHYETLLSRGFEGRHLRLFSTVIDERSLGDHLIAVAPLSATGDRP